MVKKDTEHFTMKNLLYKSHCFPHATENGTDAAAWLSVFIHT